MEDIDMYGKEDDGQEDVGGAESAANEDDAGERSLEDDESELQ